jgi:hypothetical protein
VIIDSQPVKGSEMMRAVAAATTPGRRSTAKRHVAVDTGGVLLAVLVTASVQDRDAARRGCEDVRRALRSIKLARADGG